jgi:hypothetical protein
MLEISNALVSAFAKRCLRLRQSLENPDGAAHQTAVTQVRQARPNPLFGNQ